MTMAATDEDLQKLGKPPIYSGKEDEWSECARSCIVDRCREPSDEPRHEHCGDQSHSCRGWGDSSQETSPRLGNERERTSTLSDQRNHRYQRSTGMASVDHEIRTKHSAESTESHERNPQCPLTPAVTSSRVSTIHQHHYDADTYSTWHL